MNLPNKLLLCTLTLSALSFSTPNFAASPSFNKTNIYGDWVCSHELGETDENLQTKLNYKIRFNHNGTSNGNASLLFTINGLPPLVYQEVDTALWQIEGEYLTISSNNISFSNVSHPEFEALLNLQQHFPKSVNEKVKILKLTKKSLAVQSKNHSDVFNCGKG